jgi:hypothetical protein
MTTYPAIYPGGSMILDPETGLLSPNPADLARGPAREAALENAPADPVSAEAPPADLAPEPGPEPASEPIVADPEHPQE